MQKRTRKSGNTEGKASILEMGQELSIKTLGHFICS